MNKNKPLTNIQSYEEYYNNYPDIMMNDADIDKINVGTNIYGSALKSGLSSLNSAIASSNIKNKKYIKTQRELLKKQILASNKSYIEDFRNKESKFFIVRYIRMTDYNIKCINFKTANTFLNLRLKNFVNNGFQFSRDEPEVVNNINNTYKFCVSLFQKNKSEYENTTIEAFIEIYKVLNDSKINTFIKNEYKRFKSKYKESISVLPEIKSDGERFYYTFASLYIALFMNMYIYLIYTTSILINELGILEENNKAFDIKEFELNNKKYTTMVTYPMFLAADEFLLVDLNKTKKSLDDGLKNALSKEDLNDMMSSEDIVIVGAIIAVGIMLGLRLLLPLIRQAIYCIETLKVDISVMFEDNSDLMSVNAEIIEDKLKNERDPKVKKKLQKILNKTIKWRDRLLKWSKFWYKDQDEAAKEAITRSQKEDESYNDTSSSYNDSDTSNDVPSSQTGGSNPTIFI